MPKRLHPDAFWERQKLDVSGCVLWKGPRCGTFSTGYGLWGRRKYAHHEAYERAFGPVPKGTVVMHECDTPLCVNPSHLRIGTRLDNQRDMAAKGRWVNQHGRGQ